MGLDGGQGWGTVELFRWCLHCGRNFVCVSSGDFLIGWTGFHFFGVSKWWGGWFLSF